MADIESQSKLQDLQEISSFGKATTLKFEDIVYKVNVTKPKWFCKKGKQIQAKTILKGITGVVSPGETLAILGPSGSGKTTLLTALGGKSRGKLSGNISYNGKPFSNSMKPHIGFVLQDDVFYPHLTVTETLVFTALLRLPNNFTTEEKIRQAEDVIIQLGLTNCKNTIIGGPFLRGISGGERKRVSIGQELLINPSLLFLDEPTSGLDSTTAQKIVATVTKQSKGKRTILMTIHQPSSKLFYMFDKILLLSEGNSLYFGNQSEVIDYFSSIGYPPPILAMNPADFLLDLANGISPNNDQQENEDLVKQNLVSAYRSKLSDKLKSEGQLIDYQLHDDTCEKFGRWATTWWQQFTVLMRRDLKERRHESFAFRKVLQVMVVSFVAGLLWFKPGNPDFKNQVGLLFLYTLFWAYHTTNQAIFTFPKEKKVLEKERSSGMYRLSSYFMSKTISDLPMELLLPTIFVIITYWMAGFEHATKNFLYTLSIVYFEVLVCQSLGLAIGAFITDPGYAVSFGSVFLFLTYLVGGFFVQEVPVFIDWFKYISVVQHSFKLLLGSQFKFDDTYPCSGTANGVCLAGEYRVVKMVGLDRQFLSAIALGIMIVGYRFIAYFSLKRIGAERS